jgi:superfamily II helicase
VLSGRDLEVAKYHAGMDADQRAKVMRDWAGGAVDIVVATIAFGARRAPALPAVPPGMRPAVMADVACRVR